MPSEAKNTISGYLPIFGVFWPPGKGWGHCSGDVVSGTMGRCAVCVLAAMGNPYRWAGIIVDGVLTRNDVLGAMGNPYR